MFYITSSAIFDEHLLESRKVRYLKSMNHNETKCTRVSGQHRALTYCVSAVGPLILMLNHTYL